MSIKVSILKDELPGMYERIEEAVGEALDDGADTIADRYRTTVTIRTGATEESIAVARTGKMSSEVTAEEGALYLEFGTVHMAAQPAAIPAFDASVPEIIDDVKRAIALEIL